MISSLFRFVSRHKIKHFKAVCAGGKMSTQHIGFGQISLCNVISSQRFDGKMRAKKDPELKSGIQHQAMLPDRLTRAAVLQLPMIP
jgi:hypothetical protein